MMLEVGDDIWMFDLIILSLLITSLLVASVVALRARGTTIILPHLRLILPWPLHHWILVLPLPLTHLPLAHLPHLGRHRRVLPCHRIEGVIDLLLSHPLLTHSLSLLRH